MKTEEEKERKRLYDIEYRKQNKEKIKLKKQEWYKNNPELVKESTIRNKDNKKISDKKYAEKNKNVLNIKKIKWAKANPEKRRISKLKYEKKRLSEDPLYHIKHIMNCSIRQSLKRKGFTKKSRTYEILCCSYEEFKQHIESQWESWMNWDNYGLYNGELNYGWDIDHVIPTSSANTEEGLLKLNHFSNLQPLCSKINRDIKRAKINVYSE